MNTLQFTSKSDVIGATASSLCLIHCLATPFIFVAQASLLSHEASHPLWWGLLDVFFLIISFIAVLWSGKTTSKQWMRSALWISWFALALVVINEKLGVFPLPELAIYFPALALVVLHLYNRRYCQCGNEGCCVEEQSTT